MNIITHIDIPSSHLLYPYARHFIPLDTKICMVLRNLNLYQEVVYNIFKKSLFCFLLTIITLFGTPYVIFIEHCFNNFLVALSAVKRLWLFNRIYSGHFPPIKIRLVSRLVKMKMIKQRKHKMNSEKTNIIS